MVFDVRADHVGDRTASVASALSIVVSSEGGGRLISVSGELDRATGLEFMEACSECTLDAIIIDPGGLTFMDCGGYSSLVAIRQIVEARRRTVTLRPAFGQPARLIGLIAHLEASQGSALTSAELQCESGEGPHIAADRPDDQRSSFLPT